jgi:hypothetical protein
VASGWVTHRSYRDLHWDADRAAKGDEANYVKLTLDAVCEGFGDNDREATLIKPLAVQEVSKGPIRTEMHWDNIPGSGIRIPPAAHADIENLWARHVGVQIDSENQDDASAALEGDRSQRLAWSRSREAALRDAKLRDAIRRTQDGLLRCEVPGCGFCFEKKYGALGRNFAHVHHLDALGQRDKASPTTLHDLVVVCANCHAMIHRNGECRPLRGLIGG